MQAEPTSSDTIVRNATMAVGQVLVSSVALLLVFRFILEQLGAEAVGIWAIVLASTSVSRISDLGLTGSAVKFVSAALARDDTTEAKAVIETSLLSIVAVLAGVVIAVWPALEWLLALIVDPPYLADAYSILPYALVSVVLNGAAGVLMGSLDGCHRADVRAKILMLTTVVFVGLVMVLVPRFGLIGLALAQVSQAALLCLIAWIALKREIQTLPVFPMHWYWPTLKRIYRYGIGFQAITICSMLYVPLTTAFVTAFGGLSATAYFEMAHRLVLQLRFLITAANQVLVPKIASEYESSRESALLTYGDSYRVVFFLSVSLFSVLIGTIHLVGRLWIGRVEDQFVVFSVLLALAYLVNLLSAPAYFVYLGIGRLRWLILSHAVLGVAVATLSYLFGRLWGGIGVVSGSAMALALASWITIFAFHKENAIAANLLLPIESRMLLFVAVVSSIAGFALSSFLSPSIGTIAASCVGSLVALTGITLATVRHPITRRLSAKMITVFGS